MLQLSGGEAKRVALADYGWAMLAAVKRLLRLAFNQTALLLDHQNSIETGNGSL